MPPELLEQVTVYWIPGCGNCTRLKGYLTDEGVEFARVNVQQDLAAAEEMARAGILTLPVIRVGERWASGADLDKVDELLGRPKSSIGRLLSVEELVDRTARALETTGRLALQLPTDHYDDPTPTMEGLAKAYFFYADGTPYIPHSSSKSLVQHILGHGEKFKRYALFADGVHEIGFDLASVGEGVSFGELEPQTPMYRVVAQLDLTAKDIRAWIQTARDIDLTRSVNHHSGRKSVHEQLQVGLCSMMQHNRQLAYMLEQAGVAPDRPVPADDFEGLRLPSAIWGSD